MSLHTRKLLASACLLLFSFISFGQGGNIQASYSNTPLKNVLLELEEKSQYQFFFLDEWIDEFTISKQINVSGLDEALEELLSSTSLNYFILPGQNRVFVVPHAYIVEHLPEGFFQQKEIDFQNPDLPASSNVPLAILLEKNEDHKIASRKLVRIGRFDPNETDASLLLEGTLTHKDTGEPLQDLLVRLQGSNTYVLSDSNGVYALPVKSGKSILTVSGMGMEKLEQPVLMYGSGRLDLSLQESIESLEEVIISADAIKNVESTQGGEENIDAEESKNIPLVFGERDILQVARSLPGVSSAGEGASGINVRGGKTDQTLVLLDDAVIFNPTHFFGIFQALNPFTTKDATIYKGNPPMEYGGRLSSVFDIRSIDGNTDGFAAEGSIGPITSNLALEIPLQEDRSALVLGGRGVYSDWVLNTLDDTSLEHTTASFYDAIARFHTIIGEQDKISATGYYSKDKFNITTDSLYHYSNALGAVRWDHDLGTTTRGHLSLAYSDYRFGIDFDGMSENDFALEYGISQLQSRYYLRTKLNQDHTLNYGISSNYYMVNPGEKARLGEESTSEEIDIPQEQAIEMAVFMGDEFEFSDKLKIDFGLRLALYSAMGPSSQRTYSEGQPRTDASAQDTITYGKTEFIKLYGGPEFRIGGRYILSDNMSLKASIGNAYQFLHTLSNNTTISPIDTWKLSDLNLQPQKGYQASLGLFRNFMDNQVEFSVEGYYKWMDDVLDFKTGANLFLNRNVETEVLQGQGQAYGVELLLKKKSGKLNGWLGYTYSRSLYRFDSEFREDRINDGAFFPSNYDRPHDLSLISNYRITRRYSLSMNFVYQTGRPVTFPVGSYRMNNRDYLYYSDRNQARIPDYFRLDLGLNIEGNHKIEKLAHSFWTISVYNVLGRNNPYSVYFVAESGEVKAMQTSIFAIPVPSITYNFKF